MKDKKKKNCVLKVTIHRVKRQLHSVEKIFANLKSDTGLITRIYRELLKLKNNKNNSIKTW